MSTAYRYARFWAGALTVLGTLFVLAGVLLAIVLILIPTVGGWVPRRGHEVLAGVVMAVLSVLAGALLGGPLIVAGQSLRVLLAQRLLLERLNQHGLDPMINDHAARPNVFITSAHGEQAMSLKRLHVTIKRLREAKGWNQRDLAGRKCRPATLGLWRWANGRRLSPCCSG